MNAIESWVLSMLLSEATNPAVKVWLVAQLKEFESATTNPVMKAVIEAMEAFLAPSA